MMTHYEGMYNQYHQNVNYMNYIRGNTPGVPGAGKEYLELLAPN